jgi:uncharacterized membrane protein (UPF0127 family)
MIKSLANYTFTPALAVLLALFSGPVAAQGSLLELNAGIHMLHVEVAYTGIERAQGLMFRDQLSRNQGMLFVFPDLGQPCMWMKNTLIPLSVAFLDDKGVIINVEDMAPKTENSHCAKAPTRFALEMTLGWFKDHGAVPGTKVQGVERAPAPQ